MPLGKLGEVKPAPYRMLIANRQSFSCHHFHLVSLIGFYSSRNCSRSSSTICGRPSRSVSLPKRHASLP